MKSKIEIATLGTLSLDSDDGLVWRGSCKVFGQDVALEIVVPFSESDEPLPPSSLQIDAASFVNRLPQNVRDKAIAALMTHYLYARDAYVDGMSEDEVTHRAPPVKSLYEFQQLLLDMSVCIPEQHHLDQRVVLLDWDCTYDPEGAMRVLLLNEQVHAVLGIGDGWTDDELRVMPSNL